MSKKPTQLTDKQQSFVINYVQSGGNAKLAALQAGYSKVYAETNTTRLITNEAIRQRLAKAYQTVERKHQSRLCMTLEEKARVLSAIIYDVVPRDGSEPKRQHYPDAINAIKELNKMQGDYAPDKRLSVTVDATKNRLAQVKKQYEEY